MTAASEIEIPVTRLLSKRERHNYALAVRCKYSELSRMGLMGLEPVEWEQRFEESEVFIVDYLGKECGAIMYACIDPTNACDVHLIRWDAMPSSAWLAACRETLGVMFKNYSSLLRIEAYIPQGSEGAMENARQTGFELVGTIPAGMRHEGVPHGVELWVMTRAMEASHG